MKRRNFFAVLLSPLLARFRPKPKSILDVIKEGTNPGWDGTVTVVEFWPKPPAQVEVFYLFAEGIQSSKYGFISKSVSPYWHGQPPFVKLDLPEKSSWEQPS